MMFTVNAYIMTPARLRLELFASTGRFLSRVSYFALVRFFSGDALALLGESCSLVFRNSYVSCSYLIELMFLELHV